MLLSTGWYLTVHGVRGWPSRLRTRRPVSQHVILTVWSPCVEANVRPSGANEREMVETAGRAGAVCAVRMSVTPVRLGWYEGGMRDADAADGDADAAEAETESSSSLALKLRTCAWAAIWLVWWLDRVRASPVLLR